jgi:hypothetical protein
VKITWEKWQDIWNILLIFGHHVLLYLIRESELFLTKTSHQEESWLLTFFSKDPLSGRNVVFLGHSCDYFSKKKIQSLPPWVSHQDDNFFHFILYMQSGRNKIGRRTLGKFLHKILHCYMRSNFCNFWWSFTFNASRHIFAWPSESVSSLWLLSKYTQCRHTHKAFFLCGKTGDRNDLDWNPSMSHQN